MESSVEWKFYQHTVQTCFWCFTAKTSGWSLNDVLGKGKNNMNKLVEIVIRWTIHKIGFHTDIKKMYNSVKLVKDDWCLLRHIWQKDVVPRKLSEEKVIKTLIHGVESNGYQAEWGLRETVRWSAEEYPQVNEIFQNDIYVDDCLSGEQNVEKALQRADELEHCWIMAVSL